jgi:A/G-specific adenine glycosylase
MQKQYFNQQKIISSVPMPLSPDEKGLRFFQTIIWDYFAQHRRTFPWRDEPDPYKIVVSEIMLQQTQTHRVEQKYKQFIELFPNFDALAIAPLHTVLLAWQGLGYNRRALALQKLAKMVMNDFNGQLQASPDILQTLPGIGKATAGSICAFAFNKPTIFIETNIRAVFIHFFFGQQENINDANLIPLVAATVDQKNPRHWYYALMDYGVMLKTNLPNPSRKSAHHARQSKFEGSDRQIRGMILKLLAQRQEISHKTLFASIDRPPERISKALSELIAEGFVDDAGSIIRIRI